MLFLSCMSACVSVFSSAVCPFLYFSLLPFFNFPFFSVCSPYFCLCLFPLFFFPGIVPCSVTGKKLMAKCRSLLQENQDLGKQISHGRVAQLEAEISVLKKYCQELKTSNEGNIKVQELVFVLFLLLICPRFSYCCLFISFFSTGFSFSFSFFSSFLFSSSSYTPSPSLSPLLSSLISFSSPCCLPELCEYILQQDEEGEGMVATIISLHQQAKEVQPSKSSSSSSTNSSTIRDRTPKSNGPSTSTSTSSTHKVAHNRSQE